MATLVFTACGGDDDDEPNGGETPTATEPTGNGDFSDLSGSVVIDGSSTVGPIAEAAAEEFGKVSDVDVTVGISGTSGGFEKFCQGETDISDASRPIRESEVEACTNGGVDYVEIKVGIDGLSIVVNPDNDWATCLSWSQLRTIWDQGSEVDNWNDIDPSFPDQELVLFSPGADSGTFDYFTEEINGEVDRSRNDSRVTFSEDDNQLVQGVQNNTGAMAYFGYAYFIENEDTLKALEVNQDQDADGTPVPESEGGGCLGPTSESINSGTYSLSRPLFMYVSKQALAEKPQVGGFMEFVLTNPELVSDVGYVALPDAEYEAGLTAIEAD
jgi:phosphate transport system substrate-binding protein